MRNIWWHAPGIPALRRLRKEVSEFEVSLGKIGSSRTAWATQQALSQKTNK
jgi:hypothetical protein